MTRAGPTGKWMSGFRSAGPASNNKTRFFGSALNRFASTHPADPAPTMMKSNSCGFSAKTNTPLWTNQYYAIATDSHPSEKLIQAAARQDTLEAPQVLCEIFECKNLGTRNLDMRGINEHYIAVKIAGKHEGLESEIIHSFEDALYRLD